MLYPIETYTMLKPLVDTIAELLEAASRLCSRAKSELDKQQWFITRALLWTSWQRCMMIYFTNLLDRHLISGFDNHGSK